MKARTHLPKVWTAATMTAIAVSVTPTASALGAAPEAAPPQAIIDFVERAADRGIVLDSADYRLHDVIDGGEEVQYVLPLGVELIANDCDPTQEPCTPNPIDPLPDKGLPTVDTHRLGDIFYTVGVGAVNTGAGVQPVSDPVPLPYRPPLLPGNVSGDNPTTTGNNWRPAGSDCFARLQNNTGWNDTCYSWWQFVNDGDPNADVWSISLWGTCKSKGQYYLQVCQIASIDNANVPTGNPTAWADWFPRSDLERGNCFSPDVNASYKGFGVGVRANHCDMWDIGKSSQAARFTNAWKGRAFRSEREVAYTNIFKTAQAESPNLSIRIHHSSIYGDTVPW